MKKSLSKIMAGLLGTSLGLYMMAAPLMTTVSASPINTSTVQTQNQNQDQKSADKKQKHDKFSKEDMTKRANACHKRHLNDKFSNQSPVDVVKACASELGFDASNDIFTLVSENQSTAVVQVMHEEDTYHVTLTRSNHGQWTVSSME